MEMGLPGSTEDLIPCVGPEEGGRFPTEHVSLGQTCQLKSKNSVGEYGSRQGEHGERLI